MVFSGINKRMRSEDGFTLIEMVVVLVLIAILAAISVPIYRDFIDRQRRKGGEAALYTILTAAKTYYYRNGDSFTGSICACDVLPTPPPENNIWLDTAEICQHWDIGYDGTAGSSVTITATGQNEYAGLGTVTLIFNATTGVTTINGNPV